jgi:hypothetical protein
MAFVYVQRDGSNNVVAVRSHPHPDGSEKVADDHADVLAHQARRAAANAPKTPAQDVEDRINADPAISALVDVLADRFPATTRADLITAAKAKAAAGP